MTFDKHTVSEAIEKVVHDRRVSMKETGSIVSGGFTTREIAEQLGELDSTKPWGEHSLRRDLGEMIKTLGWDCVIGSCVRDCNHAFVWVPRNTPGARFRRPRGAREASRVSMERPTIGDAYSSRKYPDNDKKSVFVEAVLAPADPARPTFPVQVLVRYKVSKRSRYVELPNFHKEFVRTQRPSVRQSTSSPDVDVLVTVVEAALRRILKDAGLL